MLKSSIIAAFTLVTLSLSPVPVVTGPAQAQAVAPCTSSPNCRPPNGGGSASTYQCSNGLGMLRRVYEEELQAIDNPHYVSVVPVCEGEDYGLMRSDGNAGALRTTIADNDAMMEALSVKNFRADDVIAIRMTSEEKVILYVHVFHQI